MDLGVTSKTSEYYLANLYQKNKEAGATDSTSFFSTVSAKAAEKADGMNLEAMWKSRYPGAYYHVMDGSKISQRIWERNDFPFERFFSDKVDESILDWKPTGPEPSDFDPKVISRRSSVAGQMSIIVNPALEEKMKNDPELAKRVMANVENFIEDYQTYHAEPGCSYLIELTEDGEIGKYCVTGPLRFSYSVSGNGRAEDYYKLHEEFERIAKENAIKRKLQQQELDKEYYQSRITKKSVSDAYEPNSAGFVISGISAGYNPTVYMNTNTPKSTKTALFAETIAEKAAPPIDWEELAFEHAGPNAPQSVKDAWMEASKEAGANGLGYTSNGINVTEMYVQQLIKWYWGGKKAEFPDVLGSSVESAIQAAQQALYNFDHPLEPNKVMSIEEQQARMKERQFYVIFLEKLEDAYYSKINAGI